MKEDTIHIYEENTRLFWALLIVVCMATGTFLLADTFIAGDWSLMGIHQLLSLLFFIISFYGIIHISSPLLHFILTIQDDKLIIDSYQGKEIHIDSASILLNNIAELRIAPHTPRAANEALFDFSASFHLLYRLKDQTEFKKLIQPDNTSFTLKVKDLANIMRFLEQHQPAIEIAEEQLLYLS